MLTIALLAMQLINLSDSDGVARIQTAKTAAIFFEQGPTMSAPYTPDIQRARKQALEKLSKWKGFAVVSDPDKADIVIVITELNESVGSTSTATINAYSGYASGTSTTRDTVCLSDHLRVFAGGKHPDTSSVPLWTKHEACGFSWPLNRAIDSLRKVRDVK